MFIPAWRISTSILDLLSCVVMYETVYDVTL